MLKKKWFFYLTEFFSGMSVMAIELGASRLLAPYFSSSQIVWTIIIGAIMIAMALGNIWGGRLADKNPSPDKMYMRVLIVGVWTAAIPLLGKYVIALVSLCLAMVVGENFLILASLFSCLLLFVFPLMLLGSVSPALVKYAVKSLEDNGRTVGELNALNTVGSIIGTFHDFSSLLTEAVCSPHFCTEDFPVWPCWACCASSFQESVNITFFPHDSHFRVCVFHHI